MPDRHMAQWDLKYMEHIALGYYAEELSILVDDWKTVFYLSTEALQ